MKMSVPLYQVLCFVFVCYPLLSGIYLMVVLSMSCLSILFSVYILSLHHQRGKPRRCPKTIKYVICSIIAPALCLKLRSSGHMTSNKRKGSTRNPKKEKETSQHDQHEVIDLMNMSDSDKLKEEYMKMLNADNKLNDIDPILKHYRDKESSVNELIVWLHTKQRSESIEDESFQEWRDIAFVLDRLLFVVFLFVTVISTAYILSLRPEHEQLDFTEISF